MTQQHSYQKGDRVVTTGEGRTAGWSRMMGSVAQVLSARSVEVYSPRGTYGFDGVAFGHEMSLDEIAPLPEGHAVEIDFDRPGAQHLSHSTRHTRPIGGPALTGGHHAVALPV